MQINTKSLLRRYARDGRSNEWVSSSVQCPDNSHLELHHAYTSILRISSSITKMFNWNAGKFAFIVNSVDNRSQLSRSNRVLWFEFVFDEASIRGIEPAQCLDLIAEINVE